MATATDTLLKRTSRRCVRAVVLALIVAWTPAHLESERWWSSPAVVSALGITTEQSVSLERLYKRSLPAQRQASEDVFDLTTQMATRIDAGDYGDALLRLSAKLVKARSAQCNLRRQMLQLASTELTPHQRAELARLVAERRVRE